MARSHDGNGPWRQRRAQVVNGIETHGSASSQWRRGHAGNVMAWIMTPMSQSNKSQHNRFTCDERTIGTSMPLTGVNGPGPHPS